MSKRTSDSTPSTEEDSQTGRSTQLPRRTLSDGGPEKGTTIDGYTVVFSLPWIVRGAEQPQDAINIAVSEVGKLIGETDDEIQSVDISVQQLACDECGAPTEALLLVSETALVGVLLTVEVRASSAAEAETFARREIGSHLPDTPLTTVEITK